VRGGDIRVSHSRRGEWGDADVSPNTEWMISKCRSREDGTMHCISSHVVSVIKVEDEHPVTALILPRP
jgi:hypothetical protein